MGFNDTMGSYLIASQTQLLATHYFRLDKERNVRMSNTLDELLIPLGGDIFSNVSMKAALTYIHYVFIPISFRAFIRFIKFHLITSFYI